VTFRIAADQDYVELGEVMFDAVRNGRGHYSESQRQAWVPAPRRGPDWSARLNAQDIIVAEENRKILGFVSLAPESYIDFAYVRPPAQGRGLFRALYERVEKLAASRGETRLWAHSSLDAVAAFKAVGFEAIERESVSIGTESLERYVVEKDLRPRKPVAGTSHRQPRSVARKPLIEIKFSWHPNSLSHRFKMMMLQSQGRLAGHGGQYDQASRLLDVGILADRIRRCTGNCPAGD